MATASQISMHEYLHTEYRPDREYIDGHLLERNVGKYEHARIQALLAAAFGAMEQQWNVMVVTEQRIQVAPTRIRIPDVALLKLGQHPDILVDPPILVVEIMSPDDRFSEVKEKMVDYFKMGIHTGWIINPRTFSGQWSTCGNSWISKRYLEVPGTAIGVDLNTIFSKL